MDRGKKCLVIGCWLERPISAKNQHEINIVHLTHSKYERA